MIFVCILLSVFLGDLMIKKYVEANVKDGEEKSLPGGKILIRKYHNDGIALGKLSEYKEQVRKGTQGMIAASLVYYVILLFRKGKSVRKLGLSIFLGGALCNWFDRFHQKTVTDYFSFNVKWDRLKNLVFNLSDFCIAAGLLLALLGGKGKK